jgi:diaminopimelate decarboxylase
MDLLQVEDSMSSFISELAETYGTPVYTYDLDAVRARAEELHGLLPAVARPRVLYSFKANPLPSLAAELFASGCAADLTSEGELLAAQEAGFDPALALYGGPGKGAAEIDQAITAGIARFSIESWQDLRVIANVARSNGKQVRGLLRVNPMDPPRARLAMSGVASQFGFEEEALYQRSELLREAADVVTIDGVHVYWGTQIGGPTELLAAFESGIAVAERVAARIGIDLQIVNLGGGFPWPYAHRSSPPDLEPLRDGLLTLHAQAGRAKDAQWWFESGRYLVASAGTLVARVMDLKESKSKHYLILDTGMHHLGGLSGLGRIPRPSVALEPLRPRTGQMTVDVAGQLCTPLDVSARNLVVPEVEPGDLVAIHNVGAYGLTASLVGFLGRPTPKEVAYRGTKVVAVHQWRTGHARCNSTL